MNAPALSEKTVPPLPVPATFLNTSPTATCATAAAPRSGWRFVNDPNPCGPNAAVDILPTAHDTIAAGWYRIPPLLQLAFRTWSVSMSPGSTAATSTFFLSNLRANERVCRSSKILLSAYLDPGSHPFFLGLTPSLASSTPSASAPLPPMDAADEQVTWTTLALPSGLNGEAARSARRGATRRLSSTGDR